MINPIIGNVSGQSVFTAAPEYLASRNVPWGAARDFGRLSGHTRAAFAGRITAASGKNAAIAEGAMLNSETFESRGEDPGDA